MSPELILVIAMALLLVVVFRPASKMITGGLDTRAAKIKSELDEAQQLREEAQSMLAQYQRQLHEGEAQVAAILKHAEEESARQEAQLREQLKVTQERRMKAVEERIVAARNRAVQDIRARATELSVGATRQLIVSHAGGERAPELIDKALAEIRAKL